MGLDSSQRLGVFIRFKSGNYPLKVKSSESSHRHSLALFNDNAVVDINDQAICRIPVRYISHFTAVTTFISALIQSFLCAGNFLVATN